ncbi:hypothetical protein BB558_000743 [Smittium angustum]|uniref:DUF676 domain-containing protein n=2 Tax=Smittium angustum TaxID=133377 RepID=A0A2U1JDE2_SMIAN|nr:hypothetical protein BB558_000743 [Smittium angustum]
MAALLVSTAQNLFNPDFEDPILERSFGSLSVGDVCKYRLSINVFLPLENFESLSNENKTNIIFDSDHSDSNSSPTSPNTKNSSATFSYSTGWNLSRIPSKIAFSVNNTSPIRKNLSLLKKEGPYSLSVLVKPEIDHDYLPGTLNFRKRFKSSSLKPDLFNILNPTPDSTTPNSKSINSTIITTGSKNENEKNILNSPNPNSPKKLKHHLRINHNKKNKSLKLSRLKEKPASCFAILCGGSWSTTVPLKDLVRQEIEDWVLKKSPRRLSPGPNGSLKLHFSYLINVVSEVILPPAAVSFEIKVKAPGFDFDSINSTLTSSTATGFDLELNQTPVFGNEHYPNPATKIVTTNLELIGDTASLFKLPDPIIFKDEAEPGIHLIILSHGLHGSRNDLLYLHEQILSRSDRRRHLLGANGNRRVVVLTHDVNHGKTTDGIEAGGKRIADKILDYIYWFENEDWYKSAIGNENNSLSHHRISFIGHSLGGLYNVSCLEHLSIATSYKFFKVFKPINFITIATPWLGIFELGNVAQWACSWGILRQTGRDLVVGNIDEYETEPSTETIPHRQQKSIPRKSRNSRTRSGQSRTIRKNLKYEIYNNKNYNTSNIYSDSSVYGEYHITTPNSKAIIPKNSFNLRRESPNESEITNLNEINKTDYTGVFNENVQTDKVEQINDFSQELDNSDLENSAKRYNDISNYESSFSEDKTNNPVPKSKKEFKKTIKRKEDTHLKTPNNSNNIDDINTKKGSKYMKLDDKSDNFSNFEQSHKSGQTRSNSFTETYIFKLSNPNSAAHKALRLFECRTTYSNAHGDWEVGFLTSSILLDPNAIRKADPKSKNSGTETQNVKIGVKPAPEKLPEKINSFDNYKTPIVKKNEMDIQNNDIRHKSSTKMEHGPIDVSLGITPDMIDSNPSTNSQENSKNKNLEKHQIQKDDETKFSNSRGYIVSKNTNVCKQQTIIDEDLDNIENPEFGDPLNGELNSQSSSDRRSKQKKTPDIYLQNVDTNFTKKQFDKDNISTGAKSLPCLADHYTVTAASNPWHFSLVLNPLMTMFRQALSIIGLVDKERDSLVLRETDESKNIFYNSSHAGIESNFDKYSSSNPASNSSLNSSFSHESNADHNTNFFCNQDSNTITSNSKNNVKARELLDTQPKGVLECEIFYQSQEHQLWSLEENKGVSILLDSEVHAFKKRNKQHRFSKTNHPKNRKYKNQHHSQVLSDTDGFKLPGRFFSDDKKTGNNDTVRSNRNTIKNKRGSSESSNDELGINNQNKTIEETINDTNLVSNEEINNDFLKDEKNTEEKSDTRENLVSKLNGLYSNSSLDDTSAESGYSDLDKKSDGSIIGGGKLMGMLGLGVNSERDVYNSGSTVWVQRMAQNWHTGMKWRTVVVSIDFDAHHEIVVRREGSNSKGIVVIHHLLNNHNFE